jgi:transposase
MKVYTTLPCRLAEFDLHEAAARGHLGSVGHYNFVQVFLRQPSTTALLESLIEASAVPLRVIEDGQYAIDSTGFSTVFYDRWFDQKHGKLHAQHPWVKLHVMVGTATHGITSARVTSEGDAPQLPELLRRTRRHFDVRELSADKAYSSIHNHDVLEEAGVAAYIPFKDNAVINPRAEAWSRHLCEFLLHQERFLPHYHRRSNVETVFAMIKAKFGGSVLSRRPVAQINEVLAKCVAHNLCCVVKSIFTAGLAPRFWSDAPLALVQP